MLYIRENISGDRYHRFIDGLVQQSDAFLLVCEDYREDGTYPVRAATWKKRLARDIMLTRHNPVWPSTEQYPNGMAIDIHICRVTGDSAAFLHEANALFDWQYPLWPDDLSFFREGACIFGMSAHEGYAFLNSSEENRAWLQALGIPYREKGADCFPYREVYTL